MDNFLPQKPKESLPRLSLDQTRRLLRDYEPVLRFSAGENFYPMKVDWYVEKSALRQHRVRRRDPTILGENDPLEKKKEIMRREVNLFDHYLHFVLPYGRLHTLIMIALILIHVVVVGVSMLPNNIGQFGPGLFSGGDKLKVVILSILLALWPIGQANRKVHLALVLNLFGLFFFGTLPGLGFGFLVTAFMGSALFLFFARGSILNLQKREGEWTRVFVSLLDALFPVLAIAAAALGAYLIMKFLVWVGILSAIPTPLPTRFGILSLDPVLFGTGIVLFGLLIIPGWFVLGKSLGSSRSAETVQMIILLVSTIGMILIVGLGFILEIVDSGAGRAVLWIVLLLVAVSAGFWLFAHPLSLEKGAPFLDPENRRAPQLSWNGNILFALFFGSALWTVGTVLDFQQIFSASGLFFILNLVATLVALGSYIANYILDWRSGQPDSAAAQAQQRYQDIIRQHAGDSRYWYYGRVVEHNNWVILHYMYFYAFNDWRSNAGGLNHHEGDWEAVTVYLLREPNSTGTAPAGDEESIPGISPFGVAYSQHHKGVFCFWNPPPEISEDEIGAEHRVVKKVHRRSPDGNRATTHPLIYVALGSHANYHWPDIYTTSTHYQGFVQDLLGGVERLLANFQPTSGVLEAEANRNQLEKISKAFGYFVQTAAQNMPGSDMVEQAISKTPYLKEDTRDQLTGMFQQKSGYYAEQGPSTRTWVESLTRDPPPGLPLEYAAGDGLRIGLYEPDTLLLDENRWPARLPDHIRFHGTDVGDGNCYEVINGEKAPIDWGDLNWKFEVVTENTWWLNYKGLFGRRSSVKDEGGPPGPKWDRLNPEELSSRSKTPTERLRLRWEGGVNGLNWLDTLLFDMVYNEGLALSTRKRALDVLTHERRRG